MSKINIKQHIPNTITCLNLVCGCFSIMSSLNGNLTFAAIWIVMAAIFDFCDGLSARMLKVTSAIGKELDSLSDVVSFGVAPTMIVYKWLTICYLQLPPAVQVPFVSHLTYLVFLVPALSAVRLAKFNIDTHQTENFVGMPTPANALFLGFIPAASERVAMFHNYWVVLLFALFFAILLVSPINMLSLKFKNFQFTRMNIARYLLLLVGIILFLIFKLGAFPLIILGYLLISIFYHTLTNLDVL
jgi:CDP-diacylglycerol--serine O-phosphatidyltransferase